MIRFVFFFQYKKLIIVPHIQELSSQFELSKTIEYETLD